MIDTVAIDFGGAHMLGFNRWQLFKGLVLAVGIIGVVSLALSYLIPVPPSKVTMATAFKALLSNITAGNIEKYSRVLTSS